MVCFVRVLYTCLPYSCILYTTKHALCEKKIFFIFALHVATICEEMFEYQDSKLLEVPKFRKLLNCECIRIG